MKVETVGVDTWSPAWYLQEGSAAERAIEALATVSSKRGQLVPDPIGGHRVGYHRGSRLLYAEGHPAGPGTLCAPDGLSEALDGVEGALRDFGVPVPARRAHHPWLANERLPGLAGVRRLDSTCNLTEEAPGEGTAVLAGIAALDYPSCQLAVRLQAGGRCVETVEIKGRGGRKTLGRWYDKGVESGSAPRGRLIRAEDQRRYVADTRRDVDELTGPYVRDMFQRRFVPLWRASKGVTVAGVTVLAEKLYAAVEGGEISARKAEMLAGYLLLEHRGLSVATRSTGYNRRADLRELGLALADGVLTEVEVDLHEVLERCLEEGNWDGAGVAGAAGAPAVSAS